MMPCHTRRRVLSTLAAVTIAGPAVLPRAHANPLLFFALRTLFTLGLTQPQVWAMAKKSTRATTAKSTQYSAPRRALGMAARHMVFNAGQQLLSENVLQNEHSNEQSYQYAENERDTDSISEYEVWDLNKEQSLFLKTPPNDNVIDDVLELSITNLRTGKESLFKKLPLAILPSSTGVVLTVPIDPVSVPGQYRFDAQIPALVGQIHVQSTAPVVIR